MLNNIHRNIHYKFNVFKKIKLIKMAAELEEEEAGCCRNRTAKKEQHMDHHPSLI
jgi:hypothetical protein